MALTVLGIGIALAAAHQANASPAADEVAAIHLLDCGPASLFVLMKLWGRPADLARIERLLPPRHPAGHSLNDLKAVARACGLH